MKRTFCDICNKEIKSQTDIYSVTLEPFIQVTGNIWISRKEICRDCFNAIKNIIDERTAPLDNDT